MQGGTYRLTLLTLRDDGSVVNLDESMTGGGVDMVKIRSIAFSHVKYIT